MKFSQPAADVLVPDRRPLAAALARTTHLCLAAHQDDIEIMAYHGIATCHGRKDRGFTGVVVTDGAGSPRTGRFANYTDEQMKTVRRDEQRRAARLGKYAAVIQLAHPSQVVKDAKDDRVRTELAAILRAAAAEVVYLHNPADKHDTHVAVFLRCLEALRSLPKSRRPKQVLGCEVWRNLDWLVDADKVLLDDSPRPALAAKLIGAFQSQIAGGKRYDRAIAGRRLANATFHTSHATDAAQAVTWAMDLTPLIHDDQLSVEQFTLAHLDRLRADITARLRHFKI
ncbi:GlcNAc-PI de-N-acetylase [Lacunisphaera limnophila]|uniref:GlcNAc-PI de-N-acetylase n=1 Tax=Lacunisphaera limnophila TaxID=1838286 RepID=A0A1D8AXQ4_9BACT|nr:PIG-L family deacetylase [Lacunisphaera limnophila]AOS45657.1 GlcNAc-PI de-N-acetylase [Lacunisphaera limnophila]